MCYHQRQFPNIGGLRFHNVGVVAPSVPSLAPPKIIHTPLSRIDRDLLNQSPGIQLYCKHHQ